MTSQDNDNLSEEEGIPVEVDDEFIPDDARPVCPNCLNPCEPLQNYCDKCDSNQIINPLAAYMPFVNIRFNYDIFFTMWRKTWYEKDTPRAWRLFYLVVLAMCTPIILLFGLPFYLISRSKSRLSKMNIILFAVAIVLFLIFFYFGLFARIGTGPDFQ